MTMELFRRGHQMCIEGKLDGMKQCFYKCSLLDFGWSFLFSFVCVFVWVFLFVVVWFMFFFFSPSGSPCG